jgi:hypothetical protein
MKGSRFEKSFRLASHLALHPGEWSRYWRHNVLAAGSPLDLELPWYSYAAIDFLNDWLKPEMSAFEWGCGGSTLFLARRVSKLVSMEDDAAWAERTRLSLGQHGLNHVDVRHCPVGEETGEVFKATAYCQAVCETNYDFIAVDGVTDWNGSKRPDCFVLAEKQIKPGGIILVDDIWMFEPIRNHHHAKRFQIFEGTGPCRPGVTQTAIFFY